MSLHNLQELDDNLGRRSNQNLTLTGLFSVVNSVQSISQNRRSSHCSISVTQKALSLRSKKHSL